MDKGEADHFSNKLKCQAILSDSSDLGLINRPRLWWSRIDWTKIRYSPWTGMKLKWTRSHKYHRLHNDSNPQQADDLDRRPSTPSHGGESDSPDPVFDNTSTRWCRQTSPEDASRQDWPGAELAGATTKGNLPDADLVYTSDGNYKVPTANMKEQFHQLPAHFTRAPGVSVRSRHRMIANGWHGHSQIFADAGFAVRSPVATGLSSPNSLADSPCRNTGWLRGLKPNILFNMTHRSSQAYVSASSYNRCWVTLTRRAVVDEIEHYDQDHKQISQIPQFQLAGMPGLGDLSEDLQLGFEVLGEIHGGAGWLPRSDQRYDFPTSMEAISTRSRSWRPEGSMTPGKWCTTNLKENLTKAGCQAISRHQNGGPFHLAGWMDENSNHCPQTSQSALAFASMSSNPTRSVGAKTSVDRVTTPRCRPVTVHTTMICRPWRSSPKASQEQVQPQRPGRKTWTEHIGSLPYATQITDSVCWSHQVARWYFVTMHWLWDPLPPYGASTDRQTPWPSSPGVSLCHYVDDFLAIEPSAVVQGGFEQFSRLTRILGLRMKESKAPSPNSKQKVLGVLMEIEDEEVILQPHPDRCAKLLLVIDEALATNRLSSDSACELVFLTTTMFGQLGKAALTPVYARAHGLSDNDKADQLNGPLKSALVYAEDIARRYSAQRHPKSSRGL